MKTATNKGSTGYRSLPIIAVLFMALSFYMLPSSTHAQYDLGYVDTYGDNLGYMDTYGSYDLGYVDTYGDNLGYYDTYGGNLGYSDTYGSNLGYYDTYGDNLGYMDTYGNNLGYVDTYGNNLGYVDTYGGGYNYGNTASPIYSHSTPTYGYSTPGYAMGGGYSTGGGYYATPAPVYEPIPTWPTSHTRITTTPTPVGIPSGPVSQTQSQTQNNTQSNTQTTPIHISISPSNPAQPFNVSQAQSTGPVTSTNTNNNPNKNTNTINVSGQPINITNTNINNIPAPVYQAPIQQVVQYTLPSNYQAPTCTISVSSSYYNSYNNQSVTLTWSSTNAYSASIAPNVGTVNPNGSTTVYPVNGTTIYTLTVFGQGGSGTCQTQVLYQQQPTYVAPTYQAPITYTAPAPIARSTPHVSLTQIPYTGFDFGATGNAIYWASLLSFAIAGAYLAIYYLPRLAVGKAGKGGFALAMGTTGNRRHAKHTVAANTVEHTATTPAPIVAPAHKVFSNLPTREYRNATADAMSIAQAQNADEMPRIVITRA